MNLKNDPIGRINSHNAAEVMWSAIQSERQTAPSVLMLATQPLHNLLCHNSLRPPPQFPALSLKEKKTQQGNKGLELMDVNESSTIRLSVGDCNLLVNTGW